MILSHLQRLQHIKKIQHIQCIKNIQRTYSKIYSLPSQHQVLRQKVIAIEETQKRTKDIISRDKFITSFPELAHYIEDENLRTTLNELEKNTWPRGDKYLDKVYNLSYPEKTWIRMCVVTLLERTKPEPISNEMVSFLEKYLVEKKVL